MLLFLIYLAALTYLLFFAESFGRAEGFTEYHYNLVPFDTMRRYIGNEEVVGVPLRLLNIEGNVLAFLPFGYFVPTLYPRCRRLYITMLNALCFSVAVELVQLLTKAGSFDIDDVILNTLGGLLGYLLYKLHFAIRKRIGEKR